jgi:RimJ/RimL family protein N-acetyltransferase
MILKGKYVSLKLIQQEDIELIRIWRNSRDVSKYFVFRGYISEEQQEKWFEEVSKSGTDYFFLIIVDNEPIGLTEIKNIDWNLRVGESGIFIAKKEHRNSLVSFETSLLKLDFAFYELNLNRIKGQILESNKRALRYNKWFGHKVIGQKKVTINDEVCSVVLTELTKNDYGKNISKRRELIIKSFS